MNDKVTDVRNAARPVTTTVSSGRSAGGTSLACASLTGWPTASKVHFVTYQIDSNSDPVAGTQLDCQGIVSGNTINSFSVIDGTDTGNSVGDVVEMLPTAAWGQDLADALTSQHSRTGAHVGVNNTGGLTTDTLVVTSGSTLPAGDIGTADLAAASITNAKLATTTGELGGAWQSWTPSWTNLTTGNGSTEAKYYQVGKTIFFRLYFLLGTTSSVGTSPIFTLPVTAATYPGGTKTIISTICQLVQTGTAAYGGSVDMLNTTQGSLRQYSAAGTPLQTQVGITATTPFTWASTHEINIQGFYEAA